MRDITAAAAQDEAERAEQRAAGLPYRGRELGIVLRRPSAAGAGFDGVDHGMEGLRQVAVGERRLAP
jgi:hypothetical protein